MAGSNDSEPWLRGPIEGVHPLVMPVFFSFAQVREDLARHTANLSDKALWEHAEGGTSGATVGFQLKHLAGSVDRLTTYLLGNQLSREQLQTLSEEARPGGSLAELLELVNRELNSSEERLRNLDPATIFDFRSVGRRALPTTVIGLLVHLCEHTQRHLGQAITLAQLLK